MGAGGEPKIKVSYNFTDRQVTAIRKEARRIGIPESDVVRRVLDGWLDGNQVLSPIPEH